jgi:hypothetical protein
MGLQIKQNNTMLVIKTEENGEPENARMRVSTSRELGPT